jgi:hypothetical protein
MEWALRLLGRWLRLVPGDGGRQRSGFSLGQAAESERQDSSWQLPDTRVADLASSGMSWSRVVVSGFGRLGVAGFLVGFARMAENG